MKFGVIDFDRTVNAYWNNSWNHKALLNIGDAAEYMVIEQLYHSIGIQNNSIVRLAIPELKSYRGDKLICALNIALDSYVGYNSILDEMSPDIIPVFLGMSFTDTNLSEAQVDCLKKNSPIGCRDERSYLLMRHLNVPCYLNGCTASILEVKEKPCSKYTDKIVFIDVPLEVKKWIPDIIKKQIVFVNQEKYCCREDMGEQAPSLWVKSILGVYSSKPKMIVSSRFHAAVLALANDIPAIITLEKYTFRFSWLQNYYPIYTSENFDQIKWFPDTPIDNSRIRELILRVAQARLQEYTQKTDMEQLTEYNASRVIGDEGQSTNQVLYYERVWNKIQQTWKQDGEYLYGFWGVNSNTEMLQELITENYPKAKLVSIYDMFKEITYNGIKSNVPEKLLEYRDTMNFYVIVTAYLASRVANDIFDRIDFPTSHAFLCEKEFVMEQDINWGGGTYLV